MSRFEFSIENELRKKKPVLRFLRFADYAEITFNWEMFIDLFPRRDFIASPQSAWNRISVKLKASLKFSY